ncbi:uncharacterized protein LOC128557651 [Mercenaria mercenaria]|uniref:uncharacterized protein LOC128557651 n=1 Tax=Mercenaria mercenaria TaxID=6596 RepID=UPI00234F481A|nr:uncharacterized protein LOC128557651 [Mercenaria mercenaria]
MCYLVAFFLFEVTYAYLLPYGLVSGVATEEEILQGIRQWTPVYIDISANDIQHVEIFSNDNGFLGSKMEILSTTPNLHDVLIQAKAFVTCGTIVDTGDGLPDIELDYESFQVEYLGVEPVLTGDEQIDCPGATTTPMTTPGVTRPKLRRGPVKPTAGSRKTSGMEMIVAVAAVVVVLVVY